MSLLLGWFVPPMLLIHAHGDGAESLKVLSESDVLLSPEWLLNKLE